MSYIAGTYNMNARQGSTFTETLTVRVGANPLNLTGYQARMMVRSTPSSPTVILNLTTENGKISITGATGTINLSISAGDMDAVAPRSYRYDLELVTGDTVIPLLEGAFIVKPQVTR